MLGQPDKASQRRLGTAGLVEEEGVGGKRRGRDLQGISLYPGGYSGQDFTDHSGKYWKILWEEWLSPDCVNRLRGKAPSLAV